MRRLLIALAALLAACSGGTGNDTSVASTGGPGAQAVLADAAASLDGLRSATVDLHVLAETAEGGDERVGFSLAGPLALPDDSGVPTADLTYTQIAGPNEAQAQFVSDGERAWVTMDGTTTALPPDQADLLRLGGGGDGAEGGLGQLDVGDWFVDPQLSEDGETATVTGSLDVVAAYADIARLAGLPQLGETGAEELRAASTASTIEVVTVGDERRLQRLRLEVTLGPEAPEDVPAISRGGTLTLELDLADHGAPVEVETPPDGGA